MTNFRKAFCIFMSLCFFAVLAVTPDSFFLQGNVYRQLPLYCFLEEKAASAPAGEDAETGELIVAENGKYLGERVWEGYEEENKKETENDNLADTVREENTDSLEGLILEEQEKTEGRLSERERTQQEITLQGEEDNELTDQERTEWDAAGPEQDDAIQETLASPNPIIDLSPEKLADFDYLTSHFFIVDSGTQTNAQQLNAANFLDMDMSIDHAAEGPQILIYHSHSQEAFADSRVGKRADTIVGVGDYLARLLTKTYGYEVLHIDEAFDMQSGELDRNKAYDYAREYLVPLLEKNPQIEVIIDLHRDGVSSDRKLVTDINGKDTAKIMFYNGLSYTVSQGQVGYLPNPYIEENLGFSFQLAYQAALYYPDFNRGIYLAGLRYNLHLRPKSILLEAGAQTNTVQEVKNAMEPFAMLLDMVLQGKT